MKSSIKFVAVDLASCVVVDAHGLQRCLDAAFQANDLRDDVALSSARAKGIGASVGVAGYNSHGANSHANSSHANAESLPALQVVENRMEGRAMLRRVYGALDRVLVAHVTCDPFVSAREGMSELVRWLRRSRDVTAFGVASFATAVTRAIVRRFGWSDVLSGSEVDELAMSTSISTSTSTSTFPRSLSSSIESGAPLWATIDAAAATCGVAASQIAFVSDDAWELGYATGAGCGLAIHVNPAHGDQSADREVAERQADERQLDAIGIRSVRSLRDVAAIVDGARELESESGVHAVGKETLTFPRVAKRLCHV